MMSRSIPVSLILLLAIGCDSGDPGVEGSGGPSDTAGTTGADSESGSGSGSGSGNGSGNESSGGGDGSSDGGELPPLTGPQLYASLCSGCHGLEGEGTELGYELRHPDRGLSTHVIRTGRPGLEFDNSAMAAYGEEIVSDPQLEELFDWLDSFEQPTTGEGLYADYCANCHGAVPEMGVVGEEIVGKSFNEVLEKVREGEGGSNYKLRSVYMTAFGADVLSDAEVQAITDSL